MTGRPARAAIERILPTFVVVFGLAAVPLSSADITLPQANGEMAVEPLMDVAIVGQSILYMASLPLQANVMFHTVMATKMPFAGRG